MSDLQSRLRDDLTAALRSRDGARVKVLRTVVSAIANAEAVPADAETAVADGPIAGAASGIGATEAVRRELSDEDVRAVVRGERDGWLSAADDLAGRGAAEAAAALVTEASLLDRYLSQ